MRRNLIIWLTFIGGLFYFWEYVLPEEAGLAPYIGPIGSITQVVGAFALGLGLINLSRAHFNRIVRKRPGYHNSLAFFIALVAMAVAELWIFYFKEPTGSRIFFEKIERLLFKSLFQGLNATIFSLLAFFMASAAYRAFRIKSFEAGIMMVAAILVMLGNIPFGTALTGWLPESLAFLKLEFIKGHIMEIWNSAAQRGILFGVMIGSLAMTLRIWLSLERGSFFDSV